MKSWIPANWYLRLTSPLSIVLGQDICQGDSILETSKTQDKAKGR